MAEIDPAATLLELDDERLSALHGTLHSDIEDNAAVELHHLVTTEMGRRGLSHGHQDDVWALAEIEVDKAHNVDLNEFAATMPLQDHDAFVKELGLTRGDVTVMLTVNGYEIRVDPVSDVPVFADATVEKTIRERDGKFIVFDAEGKRELGTYDTMAQARQRLRQIEYFSKADRTFDVPQEVQDAAQRAVDWIRGGKAGDGFTAVGRRRASQLAAGSPVSMDTLVRMRSYFARHAVDKKAEGWSQGEDGFPSAGRVAWDAWGGDAGRTWANSILDSEFDKAYQPHDDLNERQRALYSAIESVVAKYGEFNEGDGADGAHYMSADDNPFAGQGMRCANCVFFMGGGGCEILTVPVEADALCKLWIIPETLLGEMEDEEDDSDESESESDDEESDDEPLMPLVVADQLVKHGDHDQSVHGGAGGKRVVYGMGDESKGATLNANDVTPLSPEVRSKVDSVLPRKVQREIYGTAFEQGSELRRDNPTLAVARAMTNLERRNKSLVQIGKNLDQEKLGFHADRIMTAQGFLDGALGRKAELSRPLMGLSDFLSIDKAAMVKHGDHDQSSHGQRGSAKGGGSSKPAAKEPAPAARSLPEVKPEPMGDDVPPDVRAAVAAQVAKAAEFEPQLTAELMQDAADMGGQMEGLEFRLKSEKSLARKVSGEMEATGLNAADAAAGMSDVVRYTVTFPDGEYSASAATVIANLESRGYSVRTKNYWDSGDPYQGINLAVTHSNGMTFELQVHTATSFKVKMGTHKEYEIYRASSSARVRWEQYGRMARKSKRIPVPQGAINIGGPRAKKYQPFTVVNADGTESVVEGSMDVYKRLTGVRNVVQSKRKERR